MTKLLKKEFTLSAHPTTYIFLLCGLLVFVPNYPYEVMFFFSGLSVFFKCLDGRENGNLIFTCTLPVRKRDIPASGIISSVIIQLGIIIVASIGIALKNTIPALTVSNQAGLDANTALIAEGFILLGVFNISFFPIFFAAPEKVGKPFIISAVIIMLLIAVSVALCSAVPSVKETIDTPDPIFILGKVIFLAISVIVYIVLTIISLKISQKRFLNVNL